jgi:regulator of telomere elongation helicase 1
MDIEDLHKVAKDNCFCPFFTLKDRVAGADIIFMPYNYLIEEDIRASLKIDFQNSIIIFDEGHNVPSSCEEAASFSIDSNGLQKVI